MKSEIKNRLLENEPLDDKNVTALPGLGQAAGDKLVAREITKASQLYERIFLPNSHSKMAFVAKMKEICAARKSNSILTFEFFEGWHKNYNEAENGGTNSFGTRTARPNTLRPCLRNRKNAAAENENTGLGVHFKKPNERPKTVAKRRRSSVDASRETSNPPPRNTENRKENHTHVKPHPLTSFFMSTLEPVKNFPHALQVQIKKQVFDIVHDAETTLMQEEPQPVASTSSSTIAGYSLLPQSDGAQASTSRENH